MPPNGGSIRVMLVDADPSCGERIRSTLRQERALPFHLQRVSGPDEARSRLEGERFDVILLDLLHVDMPGLAALTLIQADAPGVPVVVIAPAEHEGLALKAVHQGAADYLIREQVYATVLMRAIQHAIQRQLTERRQRQAEEAVRASERRYRALFEQSRDAIFITDPAGTISEVNPAGAELFGWTPAEIKGQRFQRLLQRPAGVPARHAAGVWGTTDELEVRLQTKDGQPLWCLLSVAAHLGEDGKPRAYQAIVHDITDRKRAEERLQHSAFHDDLTGLPNRALFTDRLETALARWNRYPDDGFAVLFLDLNRFKVVNDSLGHAAGDALLKGIAAALSASVRGEDTVARLGGDEFAILLASIHDEAAALHGAERIQERLTRPFEVAGRLLYTSASIGIALPDETARTAPDLIRNADIAMYRAKKGGAGLCRVYRPGMHSAARAALELETDLRSAVAHSELELHYQPILALPERRLIGFEALVRWRHPARGLLQPSEFIHLAEETGLIVPIGWWVLEEACRRARDFPQAPPAGPSPFVAVNLSARQLAEEDLAERIAEVLEETGLAPERLSLEVTETALVESTPGAAAALGRLRALGVRIFIDDFGTGYSSLGYLHSLPVDGLKIDRSFVAGSGRPALVETIVALARHLDIMAVAEGIETEEQLERLERLGSLSGQGFLFSAPVEGSEADAMVERGSSATV